MTYPSILEYDAALSDVVNSLQVKRFRSAVPQRHPNNRRFIAYTGGYSRVYKVNLVRDDYALKCWTADVPDAGVRYPLIAEHLDKAKLPYFIDFGYEPEGILVGKSLYPTLWMRWVSGHTLCPFMDKFIDRPDVLLATARAFRHMVVKLHTAHIAHGDLQDGNIIADVQGGWVDLTLIDYDSMAVPALFGAPASISGQSNYQSPYRDNLPDMSERQDYFSELVIYLSLRAYAEKPALWMAEQDKQLLFEAADFEAPGKTAVWQKLDDLSPVVRYLADRLCAFSTMSDLNALQPLEQVLAEYKPAAKPVTKPLARPADAVWDDFIVGILSEQPVEGMKAHALLDTALDEGQIADVFEVLPMPTPKPSENTLLPKPTPSGVSNPEPVTKTPTDRLTVIGWTFAMTTAITFLLLMSGVYGGGVTYLAFIVSGAILLLTLVIALLRALSRALFP